MGMGFGGAWKPAAEADEEATAREKAASAAVVEEGSAARHAKQSAGPNDATTCARTSARGMRR